MFYIHGGAFSKGDGGWQYYGADYLLEQDVIVVTINYRLGVFGFLTAPDLQIYGNMGLKDQVINKNKNVIITQLHQILDKKVFILVTSKSAFLKSYYFHLRNGFLSRTTG